MAAISNNISLTVPFTKAFLARYGRLAARVELKFDFAANSLSLLHVNFWQSKDVVHLDTPLADDPTLPSVEVMAFYQKASMMAVEWSRLFPLEKQKDNTYKTTPWDATLIFYANSVEETFLYWMLYDLYPKDRVHSFNQFLAENMKPSEHQLAALKANEAMFESILTKCNTHTPLTPEEKGLLDHSQPVLSFLKGPKKEINSLLKIHSEMKKIPFPQPLDSLTKLFPLRTTIESKETYGFAEKNKLYLESLPKRASKIEEMD